MSLGVLASDGGGEVLSVATLYGAPGALVIRPYCGGQVSLPDSNAFSPGQEARP